MRIVIKYIKNSLIGANNKDLKIEINRGDQSIGIYHEYTDDPFFVMNAKEFIVLAKTLEQFLEEKHA